MEIKPLFTPEQAQQLSDALDKFISVARDNLQSNIRAAFPFMFEGNSSELFDTSAVEDLIRVTNTEGDTVADRRALEPLAAVAAELKRMSDDCGNALTHVLTGEQRTKLVERREAYDTAARMIERAMSDVR